MSGFTINTVTVSGNLTKDPDLRSTGGGTSVCRLSMAVNERYKDRDGQWSDRANFFDVTVWSGLGEWLSNNLHKGDGIVVEGRLRWESWEAQDGSKRSAVKIVADSVVPMPRGDGQRSSGGNGQRQQPQPSQQPVGAGYSQPDVPFDSRGLPGGDEIPF